MTTTLFVVGGVVLVGCLIAGYAILSFLADEFRD